LIRFENARRGFQSVACGLDEGSGFGWVNLRMELMVTIEVKLWMLPVIEITGWQVQTCSNRLGGVEPN
jgi:hypothetical protein